MCVVSLYAEIGMIRFLNGDDVWLFLFSQFLKVCSFGSDRAAIPLPNLHWGLWESIGATRHLVQFRNLRLVSWIPVGTHCGGLYVLSCEPPRCC